MDIINIVNLKFFNLIFSQVQDNVNLINIIYLRHLNLTIQKVQGNDYSFLANSNE